MNLRDCKKIYVVCPAGVRTGGPELLHQLVYNLNLKNKDASIVYTGITSKTYKIIDEYKNYVRTYLLPNEIEDNRNNLIIVPETNVILLKKYKNIQKAIWWLSVDNFFKEYFSFEALKYRFFDKSFIFKIKYLIKLLKSLLLQKTVVLSLRNKLMYETDYNFCQSEYAVDFCKTKKFKNIIYLADYINDDYFHRNKLNKKENIVIYNPEKGARFTNKIIKTCPEVKFIPIKKMSRIQVLELMDKAKVYIDFGNHPGMDRMPREACLLGCIIITDKKGSARFYKDVPIDDTYKFQNNIIELKNIRNKIISSIENYDTEAHNMDNYKLFISKQKKDFINDIDNIFCK